MPETPERTALYRHFDVAGNVLYIGVSMDPEGRWMAHRGNQEPWIHQAVRRADEWHDSRPDALAAEAAAIKAERPPFNGKHNYDDATFDPDSWPKVPAGRKVESIAELMRSEIVGLRWSHGQRIPSLRTLSTATGASTRLVSKASAILQDEGFLDFQPGHGLFVTRPNPL
jgi:predicted GIY-YIG superfamily endonuclease